MTRPLVTLLTLLLSVALLAGCASRREMPIDVALFPSTPVAPETRAPGRVAVLLQPAVKDLVHEGEDGPARSMRIPIGRIVAKAMLASAAEVFTSGADSLEAAAGDDMRYAATLIVQSARVSYHSRLLWMLPLPFVGGVGDSEFDAQLALDVTVLDPQGRVVWTRTYDDGRQVWPHEWIDQAKAPDGLLRVTHEAAWRLSQNVMRDLREWAEGERIRPRNL